MGKLPRLMLERLKDPRGTELGKIRIYLASFGCAMGLAMGTAIWFSNFGMEITKNLKDGVWAYPPEHYDRARIMMSTFNPKSSAQIAKEVEEDRVFMDYGQKAGRLD